MIPRIGKPGNHPRTPKKLQHSRKQIKKKRMVQSTQQAKMQKEDKKEQMSFIANLYTAGAQAAIALCMTRMSWSVQC
eukprot:3691273-Amphidinium_carterae.1